MINGDVVAIAQEDVEHALKKMNRGGAEGEDGVTVNLLKDGEPMLLGKLAKLYNRCLRTRKVPVAWKSANIIIIEQKGDIKELKNFRPIILLSLVYRLLLK